MGMSTGTSVFIVARNFENLICSALSTILRCKAPFSESVLPSRFSTVPHSDISFIAVFFAHSGTSRNVVDRIAFKGEYVDHLLRRLNAVTLANLLGAAYLHLGTAERRA